MSNITEEFEYNGHTIKIVYDEVNINPRTEWDNLGTMVCFHNRYNLGDKDHGYNKNDYNSWYELEKEIYKNENPAIWLPLFLYDHSGITISTSPFSCPWDSGRVGFIFISKEKVLKEYGGKRVTKKLREKIKTYLQGEVETYDSYLRGECYGYQIFDKNGDEVNSCWGYLGDIKYCIEEAKRSCPVINEEQVELVF